MKTKSERLKEEYRFERFTIERANNGEEDIAGHWIFDEERVEYIRNDDSKKVYFSAEDDAKKYIEEEMDIEYPEVAKDWD